MTSGARALGKDFESRDATRKQREAVAHRPEPPRASDHLSRIESIKGPLKLKGISPGSCIIARATFTCKS